MSYPHHSAQKNLWIHRTVVIAVALPLALAIVGCKKTESSSTPAASSATPTESAKKQPLAASTVPLGADGVPHPGPEDRCPMCAMVASHHANWAGAIELADGSTYYTCSVRCTLATSMQSEKFLGVPISQIKRVQVPDYLHKDQAIAAKDALYVTDSDVRGPMGLELVPASSQADADTIVTRHQGRILRHNEVTMDVLKDLKARSRK